MTVRDLAQRALTDLQTAADKARAAVVGADQTAAACLMARLAVEADAARQRLADLADSVRGASRG